MLCLVLIEDVITKTHFKFFLSFTASYGQPYLKSDLFHHPQWNEHLILVMRDTILSLCLEWGDL